MHFAVKKHLRALESYKCVRRKLYSLVVSELTAKVHINYRNYTLPYFLNKITSVLPTSFITVTVYNCLKPFTSDCTGSPIFISIRAEHEIGICIIVIIESLFN